jgi:hypothetical protein
MTISDLIEEMDFILFQHESSGDGVYGGVTPSLVKEATLLI